MYIITVQGQKYVYKYKRLALCNAMIIKLKGMNKCFSVQYVEVKKEVEK